MNKSLRTFSLMQKIDLAKSINGIVWFIRKIPILGNLLGDKYRFYELKQIVFFLHPVFSLIWQLIKSAIVLSIAVTIMTSVNNVLVDIFGLDKLIASSLHGMTINDYSIKLLVPSFLYLTTGSFRNMIVDNGSSIHELYTNFGFDPESIAKAHLYYLPIQRFIGRSIVFMVLFKFIGRVSIFYSLAISLAILLIELAASIFWMDFYLKREKSIMDNGFVQFFIIIILSLSMHIASFYLAIPASAFSLSALAITIFLFIFAFIYMKNFNSYAEIIEKSSRKYELALEGISEASENQIKIKEKNLGKEKVVGTGFKKLNKLFFIRHRRVIRKPIIIKTSIVLAISLALGIYLNINGYNGESTSNISTFLIPLIMYILLKQDNILRSMYLNCDKGLMPYGFYRENKNVLLMYKERFKSLLKIIALPSIAIIISYLGITYFDKSIDTYDKILSVIYIGLLGLFFVNLPLMEYYLLQPLDQEGKKVGKLANLIDWLVYAAVFFILPRLGDATSATVFIIVISTFIIAFIIVSQILIYKLSHKTFRIRS